MLHSWLQFHRGKLPTAVGSILNPEEEEMRCELRVNNAKDINKMPSDFKIPQCQLYGNRKTMGVVTTRNGLKDGWRVDTYGSHRLWTDIPPPLTTQSVELFPQPAMQHATLFG